MLVGDFDTVDLTAAKANVKVPKGSVATIYIRDTAASSFVHLAEGVQLETLFIEEILTLEGAGKVQSVEVNAPGLVILQGNWGRSLAGLRAFSWNCRREVLPRL